MGLRAEDVASDGRRTSLLFGRRERGERSKTGFFQGAIVGSPYLGEVVARFARSLDPGDVLFTVPQARFRQHWWDSLRRLGLMAVGPPHRLRHTGAGEFVARGGSLEQCRRRGRWAALSSVQRYTKSHFVVRARAALPAAQRIRGERFWASIALSLRSVLPAASKGEPPLLTWMRWGARQHLPAPDPSEAPHLACAVGGSSSSRPSRPEYEPEFRPHAGGWASH